MNKKFHFLNLLVVGLLAAGCNIQTKEDAIQYTDESCFTFNESERKIIDYDKSCGVEVIIPPTINGVKVEIIGKSSFWVGPFIEQPTELESVILPNTVYTIEDYAFANNNLSEITIPESVRIIGIKAFDFNDLSAIFIEGDQTRFNEVWDNIKFPPHLKP